jgi:hypothetical protein
MSRAQDLIAQIDSLWQQLRAEIGTAAPPQPASATVSTAAQLASALQAGGSYQLASGSYVGNFVVTKPVTLTGPVTAVLAPADALTPPLVVKASGVLLQGFTVLNGAPDRETVVVGDADATSADVQPNGVVLDSLTVKAGAKGGHRGISLHGANLTVRKCNVTGFWLNGTDAQAIWINNGPGPYTVEDCHLEGSGENLLVGGWPIRIPNCIPSDISIKRNTFFKPEAWRTNGATVKNLLELKAGLRVVIADNIFDGCWKGGQDGTPILFTTRNQPDKAGVAGPSPWVQIDAVTFSGNEIRRAPDSFALSILGADDGEISQQTKTITIEHNLWRDARAGFKIGNGVTDGLIIRNNTIPLVKGNFLSFYDTRATKVQSKMVFVDNVVASGDYGISSAEFAVGTPTLNGWTPGVPFSGNVIEKSAARVIQYPTNNTLVDAGKLLSLLDPATLKLLNGTAGY